MRNVIRPAINGDIPRIVEMSKHFHTEALLSSGLGYVADDIGEYTKMLLENAITEVFVLEVDGVVQGTIAGIVAPFYLKKTDIILTEHWIWIETAYRGNGQLGKLISTLINWGKSLGANKLMLVSVGSLTEERVKEYYVNKGFSYLETHFIRGI